MHDSQVCELARKEDLLSHHQWGMSLERQLTDFLLYISIFTNSLLALHAGSFGSNGDGKDVPPDAWLVYDVELLKVR